MLIGLAERAPVLLAIDDAGWIDASSAAALTFVARRLDEQAVGFLATTRTPAEELDPLALERSLGADRVRRIILGPLAPDESSSSWSPTTSRLASRRPKLRRIAEASGGNPLFALDIAHSFDHSAQRDPGDPLVVPDNLNALVNGRIDALSAPAKAALLAAAALVRPTVHIVEQASSESGLAEGEESRLVRVERGPRDLHPPAVRGSRLSRRSDSPASRHAPPACRIDRRRRGARPASGARIDWSGRECCQRAGCCGTPCPCPRRRGFRGGDDGAGLRSEPRRRSAPTMPAGCRGRRAQCRRRRPTTVPRDPRRDSPVDARWRVTATAHCACWRSWSTTARAVSRPPRCSPTSPTPRMTGVSKRGRAPAIGVGLQPAGGSRSGTGAGCSRIRPGDRVRGLRPVVWCARRGAFREGVGFVHSRRRRRSGVARTSTCPRGSRNAGPAQCHAVDHVRRHADVHRGFCRSEAARGTVRRSRTAGHRGRDRRATHSCLHGVDGGAWRKSRAGVGLLGRCRAPDVGAGERTHPSPRADAQRPRTGAAGRG